MGVIEEINIFIRNTTESSCLSVSFCFPIFSFRVSFRLVFVKLDFGGSMISRTTAPSSSKRALLLDRTFVSIPNAQDSPERYNAELRALAAGGLTKKVAPRANGCGASARGREGRFRVVGSFSGPSRPAGNQNPLWAKSK